MPFNPSALSTTPLFKYMWTHADEGLAHRGLDEVTVEGAQKLSTYALNHELDGTESAPEARKIDADERAAMKAILEHDHYGAFFELDARPIVFDDFGIDAGDVHIPVVNHPKDAGVVKIAGDVSTIPKYQLRNVQLMKLGELMSSEYKQNKAYFEAQNVPPQERAQRTLGLLKSYADALWSHGEQPATEAAGHALLDAFEALPYANKLGASDFNGVGWGAAQSLVLGLDPNKFDNTFPDAFPTAETTYLSMSDKMAAPMARVDAYREALGLPKKAAEFEKKSPLGFMIGEESGHYKRGNLSETKPFSSSGLNWGKVLFPNDAEIAALPPKSGFEFPIDCLDGFNNFVVAKPAGGDHLIVQDTNGKRLKVEKVIEKDADGKAIAWTAKFTDAAGETVAPEKVLGRISTASGHLKGDGKSTGSVNMWWWGFCDRNTAQRLYKSKFQIPQLDRDTIKVKAGDKVVEFSKEDAQKLLDADIPDIVTGETYCGFRFNDEPQQIALKSGKIITGRVRGLSLEPGPGTRRLEGDLIAVHDAPGRPMLGTIEVTDAQGKASTLDVKKLDKLVLDPDSGEVTAIMKEGYPKEVTGKLTTSGINWDAAESVDGKKVISQTDTFAVRGELVIELANGGTQKVTPSEVSQIVGENQKALRLSQYMTWVSQNRGMYASDGSTGVVVSNGMRWVNKIDVEEFSDDKRPKWAPDGDLMGMEGPLDRQPGDKLVFVRGLYAYKKENDPTSTNFAGWVQVSKHGRILNEGFTSGQPDFGWAANGKLDWNANSSFNEYTPNELRLKLLVNGIGDTSKLEAMAKKLNLPSNWKSHLVDQGE